MVPYEVDTGSDGNIMPFHIYKKLFPSKTVDQLAAAEAANIKLKTYDHTITQLGRCKVKIENNNKCKTCIFFVVLGDGESLIAIPDIELLNISNINYSTIGAEKDKKGANCNANRDSTIDAGSEQQCANTGPERNYTKTNSNAEYYTNIGSIQIPTLDHVMPFCQWLTIMRLNILLQTQAER